MLGPYDRQLYSSLFVTPPGFTFDSALGTTFSLDLESLLFVPYCIASQGAEPSTASPIAVLESIQRTAERVTVFCQDGETNAPEPPSPLYGLLEDCILPARVRTGGALFHPKLWVIRFVSTGNEPALLRVVVLSRNLTRSRAWDAMVCLHGKPRGRALVDESLGLQKFIRALPSLLSTGTVSPERAAQLKTIADEVGRTSFESPEPFSGLAHFEAFGLTQGGGFQPSEVGKRVLAVSPFVSSATLRALTTLAPNKSRTLIGRAEELARCEPSVLDQWQCMTLNDGANPDEHGDDPESTERTADAAPQGLHAKALVIENARSTVWYLGSANLTDPVRSGAHVELMVKLSGPTTKVGIDAFLGDTKGFRQLLLPYEHTPLPEDPREGSRALVEKTRLALVDAPLSVRCVAGTGGWSLVLEGATSLPSDVKVLCRPVSLPTAHSRPYSGEALAFDGLAIETLTSLFLFEVSAGAGDSLVERTFSRKLPTTGIPADRNHRIARAIIKDRSAFLQYLRCVLTESGDLAVSESAITTSVGRRDSGSTTLLSSGLLEGLVRALHQNPERLHSIRRLVESSLHESDEPDSEPVMPPEFLELWGAFRDHLDAEPPR